jgi:4-amino-4-deoxy-L-arabinose transferase-like glycosyltransferase
MNGSGMAFEEPAPRIAHGKPSQIPAYLLAALITLLAGCIVVLASVPPVDRDALTHHLAVPKLYLKHGGMVEIPSVPFSYYPMNLDLLYLVPLYFGNDIVPKFIHFAFAFLTAWLIYGYLRQRLEKPFWGLLGAFMFLSLPVIVKLSVTVYVDLGLIFFSTGALLYLLKWAANGYSARHLILAGVFCGLALGTKYNGLVTFFLLACLAPVLYARKKGVALPPMKRSDWPPNGPQPPGGRAALKAIASGVVFSVVALAVFSPWMVRNFIWTRNPVYPLYSSVFTPIEKKTDIGSAEAADDSAETGMNHFVARKLVFNESMIETLSIPIRIFFQGEDNNPKYFDGRLNLYLLLFPLFGLLGFRRLPRKLQNESLALAGFAVLYLLFAFVQTDMRIRYVAPIIPPLVILAVIGISDLSEYVKGHSSWVVSRCGMGVVVLGVVLFLVPNLQYAKEQFQIVEPLRFLSGDISRDDYIQKFRPEYAAMRYINSHLPLDARVLGVFLGNRRYYCDRDLIFDGSLEAGIRSAASAEVLATMLREKGFTHVIIQHGLFDKFILSRLSADRLNLFQIFITNHTKSLFSEDGHIVFELNG